MSTIFADVVRGGATHTRTPRADWRKQLRVPIEVWSGRRRALVAAAIAMLVFATGAHSWVVADLGGVERSRSASGVAAQRLADAQRALAQLPALRRDAALIFATRGPAAWTSADDVRVVSGLAAQSGVALLSVEPGAASGAGAEHMRPMHLSAQTDFVHLMALLHGLSDLPVLIVPEDVTVRRTGGALSVQATLRVFSGLRPVPADASAGALAEDPSGMDDDEEVVFFDPFATPPMLAGVDAGDLTLLRLAGLLHDRSHGLALLDTPDGPATVVAGQTLGAGLVTRVDALGITVAGQGASRTLALAEAS